uniref:Neurotransmitter-gated ion-channel ligand-binding domain-containing protein n=1 Tax=Romanomermis culicivorax TaxID=13658 RepID=A0A915IJC8_ROMCU
IFPIVCPVLCRWKQSSYWPIELISQTRYVLAHPNSHWKASILKGRLWWMESSSGFFCMIDNTTSRRSFPDTKIYHKNANSVSTICICISGIAACIHRRFPPFRHIIQNCGYNGEKGEEGDGVHGSGYKMSSQAHRDIIQPICETRRLISLFEFLAKLLLKAQLFKQYSTAGETIAHPSEFGKYLCPAHQKIQNILAAAFLLYSTVQQGVQSGKIINFDDGTLPKFSGETHQIVRKILYQYDNLERPTKNEPVKVDLELKVLEGFWREDDLVLKLFVRRTWDDQRLKFEPKQGGRDHIHLPGGIFEYYFWHPLTFFVHAHDFESMGPATTKIYSNGTVAQKDIYKIRLYRPLTSSDRGNLKINATITLSDFRYSNRGISMNFPMESGTCLTHSELVSIENVQCAKFVKNFKGRDYDQLVIKFDLTYK